MLPTLKHRFILTFAIAVGAVCWLWSEDALSAVDASPGITLVDAQAGFVPALLLMLLAGLPAVLLGLVAGAVANPVSGVFSVAMSMMILGAVGGGSSGYFRRAHMPGGFGWLVLDLVLWLLPYVALVALLAQLRAPMRRRLPFLTSPAYREQPLHRQVFSLPTLTSGLVCAAISGLLTHLIVWSDGGQIVGGLLLSFAIGSLLTRAFVPQGGALGILLSPAIVAVAAYLFGLFTFASHDAFLAAWYAGQVTGIVQALPVHYASAAIAGACIGYGLAQGLLSSEQTSGEEMAVARLGGGPGVWLYRHAKNQAKNHPTRLDTDDSE